MGGIGVRMCRLLVAALFAGVFAAVPEVQITKTVEGNCSVAQAKDGDTMAVHYEGTFDNGTVFDSSFGRNETFQFSFKLGDSALVKGWNLALQGACVGDDLQVRIPYSLAYGEVGAPPTIPPRTDLNFRIQVLAVDKLEPTPAGNRTADVYLMNATTDGASDDEDYGDEDDPDGKPSPFDPSSLLYMLQFLVIPVAVILFLMVAYCIYTLEYPDRKIRFYRVGDHDAEGGTNRVL